MKVKLVLLTCLCVATTLLLKAQDQVTGTYWTPQKDGKIDIYKRGTKYYGKIIQGNEPNRKDFKNPDPSLQSRPVIGLEFLYDFVYNGKDAWDDGKIYDPESGKTYDCTITLTNEKNLKVRGYIGISLLGRTEVFERIVNK